MRVFHVKQGLVALGALVAACADPSDTVFTRAPVVPDEVAPGLHRLTRNPDHDVPRGVLPDGRLLYLARDLPGAAAGWALHALDLETLVADEHLASYRAALATDRLTAAVQHAAGRVLLSEARPLEAVHFCDSTAPRAAAWFIRVMDLPPEDGPPLTQIERVLEPPVHGLEEIPAAGLVRIRLRLVPAVRDAGELGTNPWGPAVAPSGATAFVSDGEFIHRYALGGALTPPDSVTRGAYPALTPDGTQLVFARPNLTDSTEQVQSFTRGLGSCEQTTVHYQSAGWIIHVRDVATGVERQISEGAEPVVLDATTVLVRRSDDIYRMDLTSGDATLIVSHPGAASPVALGDTAIAFSSDLLGNRDVLVYRP